MPTWLRSGCEVLARGPDHVLPRRCSARRRSPRAGPTTARPIVVLPEPDSPTRPTTSPWWIVRSTPSTARNAGVRRRPGYSMTMSRARSTTVRLSFGEVTGAAPTSRRAGVPCVGRSAGTGAPAAWPRCPRPAVPPDDPAQVRDGREQRLGVRVLRAAEDLLARSPALDDPAVLHDDDPVRHVGHHAHVVGDEDDAGVDPGAQVAHELEDLGLHRDVERGGRLVRDEQLGLARDRLRDHRALPLTAGELVRVGVEAPLRARGSRRAGAARSRGPSRRPGRCRSACAASRRSGSRPCTPGSARSSAPGR